MIAYLLRMNNTELIVRRMRADCVAVEHMSQQYGYGAGFYKQISAVLSRMLPDVKSFSAISLKYIRYSYELYSTERNRQQLAYNSSEGNE